MFLVDYWGLSPKIISACVEKLLISFRTTCLLSPQKCKCGKTSRVLFNDRIKLVSVACHFIIVEFQSDCPVSDKSAQLLLSVHCKMRSILILLLLVGLTEAVGLAKGLYCGLEICYDGKSLKDPSVN